MTSRHSLKRVMSALSGTSGKDKSSRSLISSGQTSAGGHGLAGGRGGEGWGGAGAPHARSEAYLECLEGREPKPAVVGVLSLLVRFVRVDGALPPGVSARSANLALRVSVRGMDARTDMVPVRALGDAGLRRYVAEVDQTLRLPVTVPLAKAHPFNWVEVSLVVRDSERQHEPEVMATTSFHLHRVVHASPAEDTFEVTSGDRQVGCFGAVVRFHYGAYGYGYSSQLPSGSVERGPEHYVAQSLFPRVAPPPELAEAGTATLMPREVPHPEFIPFDTRVWLGAGPPPGEDERDDDAAAALRGPPDIPPRAAQATRARLEALKAGMGEAATEGGRVGKLAFLRQRLSASGAAGERSARVVLPPPAGSPRGAGSGPGPGIPLAHAAGAPPAEKHSAPPPADAYFQPAPLVGRLFAGARSPVFTPTTGSHSSAFARHRAIMRTRTSSPGGGVRPRSRSAARRSAASVPGHIRGAWGVGGEEEKEEDSAPDDGSKGAVLAPLEPRRPSVQVVIDRPAPASPPQPPRVLELAALAGTGWESTSSVESFESDARLVDLEGGHMGGAPAGPSSPSPPASPVLASLARPRPLAPAAPPARLVLSASGETPVSGRRRLSDSISMSRGTGVLPGSVPRAADRSS